jgi:hypothetical protein
MAKTPDDQDLEFLPPRAAALFRVRNKKSHLAQKIILLFFLFFYDLGLFFGVTRGDEGNWKNYFVFPYSNS